MTSAESAKESGQRARRSKLLFKALGEVQAKMDSSSDFLIISSSNLRNAFRPSSYSKGILTSNKAQQAVGHVLQSAGLSFGDSAHLGRHASFTHVV